MSSSPCQHQYLSVKHDLRLQYNYCISCNTENRGPGCAWEAYVQTSKHSLLLDTFQCELHVSRQEGVQSPSKLKCSKAGEEEARAACCSAKQ